MYWEKIFASNGANKGFNFQNIQTTQIGQYQKTNPIKKWTEDLKRHFFKEDKQIVIHT